jgi:hypothetical protein
MHIQALADENLLLKQLVGNMECFFYRVPKNGSCDAISRMVRYFLCDNDAMFGDTIKGVSCK